MSIVALVVRQDALWFCSLIPSLSVSIDHRDQCECRALVSVVYLALMTIHYHMLLVVSFSFSLCLCESVQCSPGLLKVKTQHFPVFCWQLKEAHVWCCFWQAGGKGSEVKSTRENSLTLQLLCYITVDFAVTLKSWSFTHSRSRWLRLCPSEQIGPGPWKILS